MLIRLSVIFLKILDLNYKMKMIQENFKISSNFHFYGLLEPLFIVFFLIELFLITSYYFFSKKNKFISKKENTAKFISKQ
jgi:hypothetical protein